jgi:putative AlgH/UPF0301 family transcriptional regulator
VVLALAAALVATAAGAHPEGQDVPPEVQAERDAVRQACATDAQTYCGGPVEHARMMCIRQNADKLSHACKEALARLPPHGPSPR